VTSRPGRAAGTRRADATSGLIARTRWRLALVTMGLLTVLLLGVGTITAVLALRALDDSVDRALDVATLAAVQRVGGETDLNGGANPAPSATISGGGAVATADGGQPESSDGVGPGENAAFGSPAATSGPRSSQAVVNGVDSDQDREPQAADTFFEYLDRRGALVTNPANIHLAGLPDVAAVAAADRTGRDLRTVTAGGVRIRLLTVKLSAEGELASGIQFVQAGFVLTLRDEQANRLLWTILIVGLIGLVGAAALTFVITGRALVPIRSAFERERRFVATSSHELRTPIALIRANAEVLDRENLVTPDGAMLVSDIVAEADRLGRLVADLLALTTAQAGPAPAVVPLDLTALAADTIRRAAPMAAERGVTLDGPPPAPLVRVMGMSDALVQVALILIDNALKATPSGGRVRVGVGRRGRFGELVVEDQGRGVPEADRERIFEPFARLGGPAQVDGGSGLGLAIARAVVSRLGGSIQVGTSELGGARFAVSVPLA